MRFSKLFTTLTIDKNDQDYVYLEDIYSFLTQKKCKIGDIDKNIKRIFKNYEGTIEKFGGKDIVSVNSLLKYCFNNQEKIKKCKELCSHLIFEILHSKHTQKTIVSGLDLYKSISSANFTANLSLLDNIDIDEHSISTLIHEHRQEFSEKQWQSIILFEHHFSTEIGNLANELDYDKLLELKIQKFKNLIDLYDQSEKISKTSSLHLRKKLQRIRRTHQKEKIQLHTKKVHSPSIIEDEIYDLVRESGIICVHEVICYDRLGLVPEDNCIEAVCVLDATLCENVNETCVRIFNCIWRKHKVNLLNIYFIESEYLESYKTEDVFSRYLIREALQCKKVENIVYQWEGKSLIIKERNFDGEEICEVCDLDGYAKPLDTRSFDVVKEWYIETPIEIQFILSAFINKESTRRAVNLDQFYRDRLKKLYIIFDTLLNVMNKNYIGVFQDKSTNELLIEYKSVKSVFHVTSELGSTFSLSAGEKNLKKYTDPDHCNYRTFLRPYEIPFDTFNGSQCTSVCLSNCHIILMLDNLVRLTYVADPNPGEKRSKQLCTLPITIQGLPLNHILVKDWHQQDCDREDYNCCCKQREKLVKSDTERVLFKLEEKEKNVMDQFSKLMTWGQLELWRELPDEIWTFMEPEDVSIQEPGEGDFFSLKLTDDQVKVLSNSVQIFDECFFSVDSKTHLKVYRNFYRERNLSERTFTFVNRHAKTDHLGSVQSVDRSQTGPSAKTDSVIERPDQKEENDLQEIISNVFPDFTSALSLEPQELKNTSNIDSDEDDLSTLEMSMDNLSIFEHEQTLDHSQPESSELNIDLLSSFGFTKFTVPPLLCRHPPPAVGRDDDISKIAEILDNIMSKMDYNSVPEKRVNRILCGPDNKIGSSLITLIETNSKYDCFLPEFPLLHLRKSQITILFSAYRDAGIVELLKFMKEDDQTEWAKLVSIQHIDVATRYVKRLATSFHLAFLIQFVNSLGEDDMHLFLIDMEHADAKTLSDKWHGKFEPFMDSSAEQNTTFALHKDMMEHCDHIVAIALAERLGGPTGYNLLLASIKTSLPFSFLNNASSYAPYCTKMLYHHYSAGHFHRCLKECLYSTPIKNSNRNFACDTKREMDHLDAMKGFRAGSNLTSLTNRMSLVDYFNDSNPDQTFSKTPDALGWGLTDTDRKHIFPTVSVILQRNGLRMVESTLPLNVYSKTPTLLPLEILDQSSREVGKYLMLRFCSREKMFQMDNNDIPDISTFHGPASLLQKAKCSKGVTIKRVIKSKLEKVSTDSQKQEHERKKFVAKESQLIDCFSSKHNACQTLLHPDSSKPKVMKSVGIQKAFKKLLQPLLSSENEIGDFMKVGLSSIPLSIIKSMQVCLFEFAGVKFKVGNIQTGREYLQFVECLINKTVKQSNCLTRIVVCEEKYSFTPDDFKASTKKQRKKDDPLSVHHLKSDANLLSMFTFCKDTLTKTEMGKQKLSQFLSQNLTSLSLEKDVEIIIDSDFYLSSDTQSGEPFAAPVQMKNQSGGKSVNYMYDIQQRKGEAEVAVVDWLISQKNEVSDGNSIVSFITSGDIDALYIHLYAVSKHWPRTINDQFIAPVYVILQKPHNKFDIYNITSIIELLEKSFIDRDIGLKIAVVLCMGGNDFIPNFIKFLITHSYKLL